MVMMIAAEIIERLFYCRCVSSLPSSLSPLALSLAPSSLLPLPSLLPLTSAETIKKPERVSSVFFYPLESEKKNEFSSIPIGAIFLVYVLITWTSPKKKSARVGLCHEMWIVSVTPGRWFRIPEAEIWLTSFRSNILRFFLGLSLLINSISGPLFSLVCARLKILIISRKFFLSQSDV